MASILKDFGDTAMKLARNPLGIIALFQVLIYGIAGYVTSHLDSSANSTVLLILTVFLVLFPVLVLGVFAYLVVCHHNKLYAPSDFSNEENFMKALEAGLDRSGRIAAIEEVTKQIRQEIDSHPMFIFAQLPISLQSFLKHLHLHGQIDLEKHLKDAKPEQKAEFHASLEELNESRDWIVVEGNTAKLSEKGKSELGSFIELAIPRFL